MERHIWLIQSNLLKYRFLKYVKSQEIMDINKKFYNIVNDMVKLRAIKKDELEVGHIDLMYDKLIKEMMNKNNIKCMNKLIGLYFRWKFTFDKDDNNLNQDLNGKKLLSMYIIYAFPEYIISKKYDDLEKKYRSLGHNLYDSIENKLYNSSKRLIEYINKNNTNIFNRFKFYKLIEDYNNNFNEFMKIDKINKINELCKRYYEIELTISEIQKSNKYDATNKINIIKVLRESQEKTKKQFRYIDPKFDTSLCDNYCKIYDQISQQYKQAFWDKLVIELTESNYDMFYELLNDIKMNLIKISPTSTEEYDNNISIDSIKEQIINKEYDANDFLVLANYVIYKIIYLQAPIKNKSTENKWNELKKIMDDKMNNNKTLLPECIANCLKFAYDEIYDIINDIYDFIIDLHIHR